MSDLPECTKIEKLTRMVLFASFIIKQRDSSPGKAVRSVFSRKKNGKTNKIVCSSGAKLAFLPLFLTLVELEML